MQANCHAALAETTYFIHLSVTKARDDVALDFVNGQTVSHGTERLTVWQRQENNQAAAGALAERGVHAASTGVGRTV